MSKGFGVLLVLAVLGCATVDETEWCAEMRYGRAVAEGVETGLHGALISDYTCFNMTERIYPDPTEDTETMDGQTADQLTINGDVSVTVALNPSTIAETFRNKRRPDAVDAEIRNAIRSGYRNALAGWTVVDVFSSRRAEFGDSVSAYIQRSLGTMATVNNVFVRDLRVPPQLEQARIGAVTQEQNYIAATRQAQIDSVNAWASIQTLAARAEGERLQAAAYEESPALLELRAAEAMANGLKEACRGTQTCILGGNVMDRFFLGAP